MPGLASRRVASVLQVGCLEAAPLASVASGALSGYLMKKTPRSSSVREMGLPDFSDSARNW